MRRVNSALGLGLAGCYVIAMRKMAALVFGLALALACNETTVIINGGDGGSGGEAGMTGSGGSAGSGGNSGSGGSAGSGGMGGDAGSGGSGGEAGSGGSGGSGGEAGSCTGSAGTGGAGGVGDAITSINGEAPTTEAATIYFNAENCADPTNTVYDVTLVNGDGVTQVYMWAGVQNGECQLNDKRTDLQLLCRPMASSNPRTVGDNATVFDLTLQELVDTAVVDCNNTALEGQPYEIYSFRNEDPGGTDVPPDGYGVAPFRVDVTPPDQLVITSDLAPTGSTFTISWSTPTDSNSIAEYKLYEGDTADASAATDTGVTACPNAKSISVSAATLGLLPGETTYLFVSAVDIAAMRIGDGNEGELSEATFVTASLGF